MATAGEVLVTVIHQLADLEILRSQGWYRIPLEQVEKLKQKAVWPPDGLAFYQTKVFGDEAFAIRYYAKVHAIQEVSRQALFPAERCDAKSDRRYYKLEILPLQQLEAPIVSQRLRRVTFIPTTWQQLRQAKEINDLWLR